MSTVKAALIIVAITCMGLFSGIIFGWGTLQLVLEEEGLYDSGCLEDEGICSSRQNKFYLLYTIRYSSQIVMHVFLEMSTFYMPLPLVPAPFLSPHSFLASPWISMGPLG